jgi:lysophospholipase L1-like esterase
MGRTRKVLSSIPFLPVAGVAYVVGSVLRAAHRSDLPSFPNQDPSGTFGDPGSPPLRVVALGDSSITAPGVEHLDNTFIRGLVLPWAEGYRVDLICVAVGGSKARDVVEGQLEEAVRLEPDVAVVSVGANDGLRGVTQSAYEADLRHIIARLDTVAGAVVLVGIGDMSTIPRLPASIRRYVQWRGRVFDRICTRVAVTTPNVFKCYTRGRFSNAFADPAMFAPDRFHAGDEGHRVFAEEARPVFDAAVALALRRRVAG